MKTVWDWVPPVLWICPKCGTGVKTSELQPRCRVCGYKESET